MGNLEQSCKELIVSSLMTYKSLMELLMKLRMSMIKSQAPRLCHRQVCGVSQQRIYCHLHPQESCLMHKVKASQEIRNYHRYCRSSTHKIVLLTEGNKAKKEKQSEN